MQSVAASMRHEQVQSMYAKPSFRDIVSILRTCCNRHALHDGRRLHACIVQGFSNADLQVANMLIDMYAKCKSLNDAFNLFSLLYGRDLVSWNTMIGGYTLNGEADKALQLYEQMLVEGLMPDRVTLFCTLKACAVILSLQKGLQLHMQVLNNGPLWEDVKVKNTVIDMYCKCGMVDTAKLVFDSSANKSVVSWNAMILGYSHQCESAKALALFHEMQSSGVESNENTCVSILSACSVDSGLCDGMRVYCFIIEKGMDIDVHVVSALVNMYCKSKALVDASEVFARSSSKDIVVWVAMIDGYADDGQYIEAVDLFEKMLQHGIQPNDVAYLSIIKVCTSLASLDRCRNVHSYIKDSGIEMVVNLGNALIDMYVKCGSLQDADDVFNNLSQRDAVSWSTLIAGNVELGLFEEGFLLFKNMQKEGLKPSTVTFAYICKACSSMNALAEGRLVHACSVELFVESHILVRNMLVFMYVNCKSFEDASNVFGNSVKDDVIAWNAMIGRCLTYDTSLWYYSRMLQAGLKPNDATFVGLLSACSHNGLINEALCHFKSMMEEFDILASFEHYSCIIDILGRVGRVQEAGMLQSTLPFEVNAVVKTSLLSNCKVAGNIGIGEQHL